MRSAAKVRQEFFRNCFAQFKIAAIFAPAMTGTLAQLVEQWTENPCVPGSIPGGTTTLTACRGFLFSGRQIPDDSFRRRIPVEVFRGAGFKGLPQLVI